MCIREQCPCNVMKEARGKAIIISVAVPTAAGSAECHRADSWCFPRLPQLSFLCLLIAKVGLPFWTCLGLRCGPEYQTAAHAGQPTAAMLISIWKRWSVMILKLTRRYLIPHTIVQKPHITPNTCRATLLCLIAYTPQKMTCLWLSDCLTVHWQIYNNSY